MNLKAQPKIKSVIVKSRAQKYVTCPHCWTDQRTERDFCYRCGAAFVYLDEAANRTSRAGKSNPA